MAFSEQFATHIQNYISLPGSDIPPNNASNLFLALHTEDPTTNCSQNELVGLGYERTSVLFGNQSTSISKDLENSSPVIFPPASATSPESIKYYSVWTDQTVGEPISYGILDAPVNWISGSSIAFATGLLRLEILMKPANCTV